MLINSTFASMPRPQNWSHFEIFSSSIFRFLSFFLLVRVSMASVAGSLMKFIAWKTWPCGTCSIFGRYLISLLLFSLYVRFFILALKPFPPQTASKSTKLVHRCFFLFPFFFFPIYGSQFLKMVKIHQWSKNCAGTDLHLWFMSGLWSRVVNDDNFFSLQLYSVAY